MQGRTRPRQRDRTNHTRRHGEQQGHPRPDTLRRRDRHRPPPARRAGADRTGPARRGPFAFPIVSALTDGSDLDQQILVIDDRLEHRTQRHLVDIDLLELARQTADSEFAAITAGTSHHPTALTTDVALAVNVPGGVVIWVGQANTTNPLMNHSTHALPRLGIEIRKLLDPTTQARARDHLRAALVAAAGKLPIYDTAAVADAYELYERAKHQFPRSLRSVQELIGVYVPRTDEAWDVARKLHQSTPDLKLTRAIDSAAMLVDGTA